MHRETTRDQPESWQGCVSASHLLIRVSEQLVQPVRSPMLNAFWHSLLNDFAFFVRGNPLDPELSARDYFGPLLWIVESRVLKIRGHKGLRNRHFRLERMGIIFHGSSAHVYLKFFCLEGSHVCSCHLQPKLGSSRFT